MNCVELMNYLKRVKILRVKNQDRAKLLTRLAYSYSFLILDSNVLLLAH